MPFRDLGVKRVGACAPPSYRLFVSLISSWCASAWASWHSAIIFQSTSSLPRKIHRKSYWRRNVRPTDWFRMFIPSLLSTTWLIWLILAKVAFSTLAMAFFVASYLMRANSRLITSFIVSVPFRDLGFNCFTWNITCWISVLCVRLQPTASVRVSVCQRTPLSWCKGTKIIWYDNTYLVKIWHYILTLPLNIVNRKPLTISALRAWGLRPHTPTALLGRNYLFGKRCLSRCPGVPQRRKNSFSIMPTTTITNKPSTSILLWPRFTRSALIIIHKKS